MVEDLNPYAIPDSDLDELARPKQLAEVALINRHDLTGSPCSACDGSVHFVKMPTDLHPEVLDAVSILLDKLGPEVLKSEIIIARSMPDRARVIEEFIDFSERLDNVGSNGPLLRALAEVVNDMTEGAVEAKWRVYQSERELIIAHGIMKTINSMLQALVESCDEDNQRSADDQDLIKVLSGYQNETGDRINKAVARYQRSSSEAKVNADQQLMEVGVYSEDNPPSRFAYNTMVKPIQDRLVTSDDKTKQER